VEVNKEEGAAVREAEEDELEAERAELDKELKKARLLICCSTAQASGSWPQAQSAAF
jgi:hypothetical protein